MKHAYLIMAHHKFDILQKTIDALDDEDNDFYIHIDKKNKEMPTLKALKSKIFLVKRIKIEWGGYTQIKCTLNLLESAYKSKIDYDYYHFLSGATYPIKSKTYIKNFFISNYPYEFIGFDNDNVNTYNVKQRLSTFFLFNELGVIRTNISWKIKNKINIIFNKLISKFGYNPLNKFRGEIKKGTAYFSIEKKFANYVLEKKKEIKILYKFTRCADEIFMQTLVFNSSFKRYIYNLEDEYIGAMCVSCWPKVTNNEKRESCQFILKDLELLKHRKELYALKFDGPDGLELIKELEKINKAI